MAEALPTEPGLYLDVVTERVFERDPDGTWWGAAMREFWLGDERGWDARTPQPTGLVRLSRAGVRSGPASSIEEFLRARLRQSETQGKHYVEYLRTEDVRFILDELDLARARMTLLPPEGPR